MLYHQTVAKRSALSHPPQKQEGHAPVASCRFRRRKIIFFCCFAVFSGLREFQEVQFDIVEEIEQSWERCWQLEGAWAPRGSFEDEILKNQLGGLG